MPSAPTISFDWQPSRRWRAARWGSLLLGTACLAWAALEPLATIAWGLVAAWFEWRNLRFESRWRGSGWRLDGDGEWRWKRSDGSLGNASTSQATQLGPLLVLNLRNAGERIDLPIWPDQLDRDTRRRLRVRLANLALEPVPPGR